MTDKEILRDLLLHETEIRSMYLNGLSSEIWQDGCPYR
jgi:hypothetical protein